MPSDNTTILDPKGRSKSTIKLVTPDRLETLGRPWTSSSDELSGLNDDSLDFRLNNGEFDPLMDAVTAASLDDEKADLEFTYKHLALGNTTPSSTTGDAIDENKRIVEAATKSSIPKSKQLSSKTPVSKQLDVISSGGIAPAERAGMDASYYSIDTKSSFPTNLEELVGGVERTDIAVTRSVEDLIIRPKPETVAKIFILPEWSNQERRNPASVNNKNVSYATTDFALLTVQEQAAEKYQVIETFGDDILYFYGKRPTVYNFSGNLLNTSEYQWKNNFYNNYQEIMRGTKCAENKTRIYMVYDDVIVEGYILNLNMSMNSNETKMIPFSFSMFITNQTQIDIQKLEKIEPAQPTYKIERKHLKDILKYWKEKKEFVDYYRSDADRAKLAEIHQENLARVEKDGLLGLRSETLEGELE